MTAAARERARVRRPVLLVSAAAWTLAVSAGHGVAMTIHQPVSAPVSIGLLLAHNHPTSLAAGWALMLTAMMLPLLIAPLRHVHDRSFPQRRPKAMALFVGGYAAAWMAAGALLLPAALAIRSAGDDSALSVVLTAAVALAWQCSPYKQRCLNRGHAHPSLAAAAPAADRDVLCFGWAHGMWCIGSCWALMLVPLLMPRAHLTAMAAVSLWLAAERMERPRLPGWGWRAPAKTGRLLKAYLSSDRFRT